MQHRMIMFAGSSPGAGKSSLSNALFQQLRAQQIPAQWFYEEDFLQLPAFAPFLHELATSYPNIDLFLQAAVSLPPSDAMTVRITDAFLPGYHLFFGVYPLAQIERYSRDLYHTFSALQPLIVYLKTDIATAYARAVKQRGAVWLERIIHRMNTWHLPLYTQKPFRTLPDVIAFDQELDACVLALLDDWPGHTLVLDTTETPIRKLQTGILWIGQKFHQYTRLDA